MHRAAAATIPMTIPVVLLDSRTTSEGPGTRLTPGSVGIAVGILRNIGEVINGPVSLLLSTSKDVGNGSNTRSGWGFSSRLLILPAGCLAGALWRVASEAEVAVVRLWSAVSGSGGPTASGDRRFVRSKSLGRVSFVATLKA